MIGQRTGGVTEGHIYRGWLGLSVSDSTCLIINITLEYDNLSLMAESTGRLYCIGINPLKHSFRIYVK